MATKLEPVDKFHFEKFADCGNLRVHIVVTKYGIAVEQG